MASRGKIKIICVCGARPNFMKIAPIMRAFEKRPAIEALLVHTGQHFDRNMSELFFTELGIPEPDVNLEVGSGSHAVQTAEIMKRFEPVVLGYKPDFVLVVGDVNSTIACGLVAVKLGVKLVHVEAGLRSFDRSMPEEINRILTDSISDLLFVTEPSGIDNLLREGIAPDKMHLVGNVMIDTLQANKAKAEKSAILQKLELTEKKYAVATLHRPGNVDDEGNLRAVLEAFAEIQRDIPVVFPMHPRTRKNIATKGLGDIIDGCRDFRVVEPLGYLDFLKLISNAAVVLTDSGGLQEETTVLGVPCMTLRENTERPITCSEGTNRLVPIVKGEIMRVFADIRDNGFETSGCAPEYWDGHAAERITEILADQ
jgi:UDP-N-acetylglucosamine 2-epimerase (non-hydrolysing)